MFGCQIRLVGSLVGLTLDLAIAAARSLQPLQSLAATKFCMHQIFGGAGRPAPSQEESFMTDDMEKKNQQGGQPGQSQQSGQHGQQGSQPGQGQQSGQPGQYQPKKGGQTQDENEQDQNRDRQRRAS